MWRLFVRLFLTFFTVLICLSQGAQACIGDKTGKTDSLADCEEARVVQAQNVNQAASMRVIDAYAYETSEYQKNGAVFFVLENMTKVREIALTGANSPVADRLELHNMTSDSGVMKMHKIENVVVAPRGKHEFTPTGDHIMLIGIKAPLRAGDRFPLTLHFSCVKMYAEGVDCPEQEKDLNIEVITRRAGDDS